MQCFLQSYGIGAVSIFYISLFCILKVSWIGRNSYVISLALFSGQITKYKSFPLLFCTTYIVWSNSLNIYSAFKVNKKIKTLNFLRSRLYYTRRNDLTPHIHIIGSVKVDWALSIYTIVENHILGREWKNGFMFCTWLYVIQPINPHLRRSIHAQKILM